MDAEHKEDELFYESPVKMALESGEQLRFFARNMVSWKSCGKGLTMIRAFNGTGDYASEFTVKHSIEDVDAMYEASMQG